MFHKLAFSDRVPIPFWLQNRPIVDRNDNFLIADTKLNLVAVFPDFGRREAGYRIFAKATPAEALLRVQNREVRIARTEDTMFICHRDGLKVGIPLAHGQAVTIEYAVRRAVGEESILTALSGSCDPSTSRLLACLEESRSRDAAEAANQGVRR